MKKVCIILLSLFTILFFISCGSTPAAEEQEPEAPETSEVVEDVVEDSTDAESDAEAEAERLAALIEQVNNARQAAIDAYADENCPDQMEKLDALLDGLKDSSNPEADAQALIDKYNLLANYSNAVEAKYEIDENDWQSYAQSNYDRGVDYLDKVEEALDSDSVDFDKSVYADAENALKEFNAVLNVAYKKLAKEEREAALEAKKKADSVKAGVARKAEYKEAAELIQSGDSLYSMQNAKKATEKYIEANEEFTYLYEDVSEKRAAAQAAIDEAKRRVAESEKFAEEADMKAPITEQVEGIEDEDAVLLEADDYEDPEDAEAEIAEELEDEYEEDIDDVEAE